MDANQAHLHREKTLDEETLSRTPHLVGQTATRSHIENTDALCILWARLIQADESLARTAGQVEAFCHMLRQRQGYRLRGWLEEVEQQGEPELQAFVRNLHTEESAVQAGLTLAWSNGRLYPSPQTAEAASVWPGRRRLAQTADALPSL